MAIILLLLQNNSESVLCLILKITEYNSVALVNSKLVPLKSNNNYLILKDIKAKIFEERTPFMYFLL